MLLESRVFGKRFRVDQVIESSPTVTTWNGYDLEGQRPVVVKVASGISRDRQLRLVYEAELLSRLDSPHIVPLLAAGREANDYYVAMPLAGEQTLREHLAQGPMSVQEAVTVGVGLLRALEAVHSHGLFHRDLKPENILLDRPLTRSVLIDFGIAVESGPAGSLAYMAPERLGLLDRPADERSDLYEAGLVLYEMLRGRLPFEASDPGELLRAQMAGSPPGLCGFRLDVQPALEALVMRLLEKDPVRRYQQASSAASDLVQLLEGRTPVVGASDFRKHLAEPILVGREQELGQLEEQLRAALAGKVVLVRLSGASGSGKSRMLEEFGRLAQAAGARVLSGRAQHNSARLPFGQLETTFRPVANELLAHPETTEAVRPWAEVLALALESLRSVYPLEGPLGEFQPRIARSARRVLHGLPGPTVLLFDDCQWSTETLFELVDECLDRDQPMLIVMSFRDEAPEGHRVWSYDSPMVSLSNLSRLSLRRLLQSMAGPLSEDVVTWVWLASQGDPFMAVTSMHGLLESRALIFQEGAWQLVDAAVTRAGTSLRGGLMLAQRLQLLSPSVQAILEAGAVMGRHFELPAVASITGLASAEVSLALEEARRRHLIWRSAGGNSYRFAHDRVREAALERVAPEARRQRHRAISEFLVETAHDRIYEIAYNFAQAGEMVKARPYALAAGKVALDTYSLEVAEEYFRIARASQESADRPTRYRTFLGLGEVLASRGQYGEAEQCFFEARAHGTDRLDQVEVEAQLSLLYSATDPQASREAANRCYSHFGDCLPSQPLLAIGLELVRLVSERGLSSNSHEGRREAEALGRISQALGVTCTAEANFPLALWTLLYSIRRMRSLPLTRYYAAILGNFGAGFALSGLPGLGMRLVDAGLAKAEQLGDRLGLGQTLSRQVVPLIARGSFQEGTELYPRQIGLIESTGDAWETAASRAYSGLAFYYRGHHKKAMELGLEGYREAKLEGDLLHVAAAVRLCALAGLGHRCEAPSDIDQAEPLLKGFRGFADGLGHIYAGEPEKAVAAFYPLLKVKGMGFHTAPFTAWLVTACRQTAEALPAEGAHLAHAFRQLAREVLPKALSQGKRHTVSYAHALRESALLAAALGQRVRARQQFDRSLEVARGYQMDYEIAWTLVERGRIGMAMGWADAERDLGHGRSLLARMGAWLPGEKPEEKPTPVLSVVDRFSKVLESGRRIAASLDVAEIRQLLVEAALGLLRCQDCRVLDADHLPQGEFSRELVREASLAVRTVLRDEGLPEDLSESLLLSGVRSALCAPVMVHGQVDCLLYVTHQLVGQLFGEEERRIGDYLASLAGAALENAQNFRERQKATERFDTLFRWTGVGTAVVTREGHITEANPFFEEMLGVSGERVLLDTIYHADRALIEQGWKRLFEDGQPLRLEVRCLRASGELLWAQLTASRPPGESPAIVAFSDVSHRRLEQVAAFQESERRLLAAELHDGVSQPLAGLFFQLQTAALKAQGQQATELEGCVTQAQAILMEISQLMFDLRNPTSGDVDAIQAVLDLARSFSQETGIEVQAKASGGEVKGLAGTFLFRLVQEALTNIRKHSRASQVQLCLEVGESEVHGQVSDNGQGFDPGQLARRATRHFGLQGMKERAELLGGSWQITSRPGEGTLVEFRLPIT